MARASTSTALDIFRITVISLVRRPGPDLTARQLGVLLTCFDEGEPQTVRGLAAHLRVSKPAITRAVDRLSQFSFVQRKPDLRDRRSILVQVTPHGTSFVRELRGYLFAAARTKA